jgi:hypothetical protein
MVQTTVAVYVLYSNIVCIWKGYIEIDMDTVRDTVDRYDTICSVRTNPVLVVVPTVVLIHWYIWKGYHPGSPSLQVGE